VRAVPLEPRPDPAGDSRLAPRYRQALALEADGCEPAEMAASLDVPLEALGPLLLLAHAKLAAAEVV
jgi:hypothetical protein